MAGNFGEELLSEPTYLREELWRTFVSYSDLKDGDEGVEELFRSWIDPESVNVALGVDTTSGYWKLESTSPELVKLFKDTAAFRVVGRVRGPRRAFEGPCVAVVELAFRGTDRVANWATNANTFLVPTAIGGCHGKVHQGFQTAYLSLRDAILHNIDTELGKKGIQNGQSVLVRITGHSLGGALATLCAYDFACSRKTWEARCITWGCPRVGNGEFARVCLEVVPKCGRYINKMDLPSCLPVNPKDPHDYSNPVRSMLSGASSPLFKALKVSDCEHVCPCVVLDPDTSSTLHVMIAGMEMAVLAKDGFIEGMANHIFGPHYISEYAETLRLALGSAKHRFEGTWSKLPSVGTWLLLPAEMPVYEAETSPKRDASPTQTGFFSSVSSESQEFLKYGWSLLTAFRGRGPRVLIDLHDDVGRYSKQQLAAMGVQPDRFEKVPLETVLKSSPQLLHTEEGCALLRRAQEQLLTLLPMLTVAADEESQPTPSKQILAQMQKNGAAAKLLSWSRKNLKAAESDPASQANEWQEWGAKVVANNEGKRDEFMRTVSEQCSAFLTEQLRIIKVPKIESPADGSSYEYCIDNIDLSSCSVSKDGFFIYLKPPGSSEAAETPEPSPSAQSPSQSQQSSPASSPPSPSSASSPTKIEGRQQASKSTGEILRVTAKDIKVHIPELKWKYAQKTFPYFNGHGTAETVAHGAQIMMAFELHSAKVNGDLVPRLALARSQVVIEKLVLSFKESSFSWLYNTMGYLFQESVRDYVVSSLDSALKANIASLLTPLNRYLHPYWPVVLSNVAIPLEKLPSTGVEEYTVVLGQMKEPVGADFIDAKDGLTLIAIEEAGALHRWNETAAAERKVEAFDLLYEVDGKVGEELIQALDNGPLNELMFRRASAKAASEEPDAGHDGKV